LKDFQIITTSIIVESGQTFFKSNQEDAKFFKFRFFGIKLYFSIIP